MTEEEKYKEPIDSDLWPETRQAIRFLLWTLVFSLVGTVVISGAEFHVR
jgi:hypothetical protein